MANIRAVLQSAAPLPAFEDSPRFPSLLLLTLPFLSGGLPRGAITEFSGARSCGRMAMILHVLAEATARGEICAVVDTDDQFHPASAAASGVSLANLVWVRCGRNADHAMRVADLLLHSGGFGVVVLDLCEVQPRLLNRIPISYWYRFRHAIEQTPTILLVCTPSPQARPRCIRSSWAAPVLIGKERCLFVCCEAWTFPRMCASRWRAASRGFRSKP